jgi:hypothetical protein
MQRRVASVTGETGQHGHALGAGRDHHLVFRVAGIDGVVG